MKTKAKVALILAIVAAMAAAGGSWKWRMHSFGKANAPYKVAGWTWGDSGRTGDPGNPGTHGPQER